MLDDARARKIPVNAVDRPELCDFFTPALVNRAPLVVAVGTEGAAPVLAQMVRARIEQLLSPSLGRLAALAAGFRDAAERILPAGGPRRRFWQSFFGGAPAAAIAAGDGAAARRAAVELLSGQVSSGKPPQAGHVALVGAGPGAEDLLTLRAHRLLCEADAIVYDALVPEAVVALGRREADRFPVGKRKGCHTKSQAEINALLVGLGRAGRRVVRLKSGDPLVFGRAGEELQALRDAGLSHEVVPGVTAAFAAAADFALPLTLRGVASSMVFTTGHDLQGGTLPDWARLADLRSDGRRLYGPLGGRRRRRKADRGRPVAGHRLRRGRECQPARPPPLPRDARRPAVARRPRRSHRPGHDHHRRCRGRRRFRAFRTARRKAAASTAAEGARRMKVLTANRLADGEAVWLSSDRRWIESIDGAELARDKDGEERLAAIGKAGLRDNQVVDAEL